MPRRALRLTLVITGLALLSGCASLSETLTVSAEPASETSPRDQTQTLGAVEPISPESAAEALRVARILRDNGRMTAAYEIYARLDRKAALSPRQSLEYASIASVVLPPKDAQPLFVRARERLGDGEALTEAERLVLHLGLGRGRLSLGLLDDAARDFSQALEIAPDNLDALNGLGVTRSAQGHTRGASALFRRALDRDPSNTAALNNLALTRLQDGDIAAATTLLDTGDDRRAPTLALNLALAHLVHGDEEAARTVLARQFPDVDVSRLVSALRGSADRIADGRPAAEEFLAASRTPLPLDVRK